MKRLKISIWWLVLVVLIFVPIKKFNWNDDYNNLQRERLSIAQFIYEDLVNGTWGIGW